ncbi:MAG TPA: AAA family ATPase, partial [Candidatus Tumulicola sp.]
MLRGTPADARERSTEQDDPAIRFRLFGHVAVEVGGAPFKLATPRKTLPILAYLLLNRDVPVARDFLAYVMWPDDEEESARNKLRMSLHDLGRVLPPQLGDDALMVDGNSVRLRPGLNLWLDVADFDRFVRDPVRLEEGVDLYRGDLLASLYDEWVVPERERRRSAYLAALTQLVSLARRRRDFAGGIDRAQQILAIDPWREDVVRQLVALRSDSGDRAGALAEYERFAQRLSAELNVDPMPETVTLRDAIVRGAAVEAEAPFEPAGLTKAARPPILPFVGRRAEMGLLLEIWSRAARGHGAAVFIGGESGIGKSRLAIEFSHAVEERGGRVLFGTTGSPEEMPYESIVDALRSALPLVASLKSSDMWLACVAALLPEIRTHVPGLPAVPRIDGESERIRLLDALFRVLASLARVRPLLVVLEDLHWAQSASISLLDFLVRRISTVPIMIVATYRDDETPRPHPLHRVRREARVNGAAQSLWLQRLSGSDVADVVEALPAASAPPGPELLEASEGNPLFLAQLVADFREGAVNEPASLAAVMARRIERLSPEARTVSEIAACIGDRFSRDAVREVSGWDAGTLANALDELLDRRIVRE